jgi:hypothetical protein
MLLENTDKLFEICMGLFVESRKLTLFFVLPLFMIKITWLNVSGGSQAEYTGVLKGLITFFVLAYSFEYVLEIVLELPRVLSPRSAPASGGGDDGWFDWAPDAFKWILGSLGIVFYHIAHLIQFVFLVLLASLAPIVFLLSSILNVGFGNKVFFGLLLVSGCWPIVWASFDQVSFLLAKMEISSTGWAISEVLMSFMKALGPLGIAVAALSSEVGGSVGKGFTSVTRFSKSSFHAGGRTYNTAQKIREHVRGSKVSDVKGKSNVSGKRNYSQRSQAIGVKGQKK